MLEVMVSNKMTWWQGGGRGSGYPLKVMTSFMNNPEIPRRVITRTLQELQTVPFCWVYVGVALTFTFILVLIHICKKSSTGRPICIIWIICKNVVKDRPLCNGRPIIRIISKICIAQGRPLCIRLANLDYPDHLQKVVAQDCPHCIRPACMNDLVS